MGKYLLAKYSLEFKYETRTRIGIADQELLMALGRGVIDIYVDKFIQRGRDRDVERRGSI